MHCVRKTGTDYILLLFFFIVLRKLQKKYTKVYKNESARTGIPKIFYISTKIDQKQKTLVENLSQVPAVRKGINKDNWV